MRRRLPQLPSLLARKIYKTGQTRGADDDVVYQNRVARNSTVLIPYRSWTVPFPLPAGQSEFENGFIVLISPEDYFGTPNCDEKLANEGLKLGSNTLVFYETRAQWNQHNPGKLGWNPAKERIAPVGGNYVARVPGTTATEKGQSIRKGFTTTSRKGAGIRVFEYASKETIAECRKQLEALFWLCGDAEDAACANGMKKTDVIERKNATLKVCSEMGVSDYKRLLDARVINKDHKTTCPLCLEELSALGFFARMRQAEGREVPDITVTEVNIFHIEELRVGAYNHRPYNVAWGHHHCNVVTRDSGIVETLKWMNDVLGRNKARGYI